MDSLAASMDKMRTSDEPTAWTREGEGERKDRLVKKRIACIFEDSETPSEDIKDMDRMKEKAEEIRIREIKKVLKMLRKCKSADVCFIIDATGSMSGHINGVKNSISKLVKEFKAPIIPEKPESSPLEKLRLSCIAYRDHGDSKRFEVFSFSEDVSQFEIFLGKLEATGGDDGPEDVLGGLWKAKSLPWSADSGVRLIFHIGDCPPHGKQFHDGSMGDSYPSGHPSDPSVDAIFSWMKDENIYYCFGKITKYTDKMISIFQSKCWAPITVFDIKDPIKIASAVKDSISSTIDTVVATSKAHSSPERTLREFKIDKSLPDWNKIEKVSAKMQSYDMPESIEDIIRDKPLSRRDPKRYYFQIAPNPFAEGAERIAFYARNVTMAKGDSSEPVKTVCKEFKHVGATMNSGIRYELVNQMQTISSFMAFEFSEAIKKVDESNQYSLKFLKVKTISVENLKAKRYMTCEKEFSPDSTFIRFSNNAGFAVLKDKAKSLGVDSDFVDMVMAFSHWTYWVTKKYLLIVDLEGIVSKREDGTSQTILTDPAIHCTDHLRFGRLNHGMEGMKLFFNTHKCEKYCKLLKLPEHP